MAENEKLNNVAVDNDVGTMEDVDAIMKKYDRESNTRVWEGTPRKILRVLTALFGIFLIVMNMWIKMDERARRPLFLGLVIILVFIYYPIKKGSQKVNYMPWYDIVMAAVGAFCFFFYPLNLEKIVYCRYANPEGLCRADRQHFHSPSDRICNHRHFDPRRVLPPRGRYADHLRGGGVRALRLLRRGQGLKDRYV